MANINKNLTNYDVQEGFDLLEPGWYEVRVIDSQIKEGPKGDYILWTLEIIGKPNRIWDNMSLGNDVAMSRLKTLAKCCGHPNPSYIGDTEELHGKMCQVRLKVEKDDTGRYEPKNKITAFKPPDNAPMSAPVAPDPTGTLSATRVEAPASETIAAVAEQQPAPSTEQPMPWESR